MFDFFFLSYCSSRSNLLKFGAAFFICSRENHGREPVVVHLTIFSCKNFCGYVIFKLALCSASCLGCEPEKHKPFTDLINRRRNNYESTFPV